MSVRAVLLMFASVVFGGMVLAAAVNGTPRDDRLQGTDGRDQMRGDAGDDTMKAGEGPDAVYGGGGDDSMPAGTGGDRIYAGAGNDRLLGREGADRAFGGPGDDYLRDDREGEGSFRDELFGEDGDDTFEVSDDGSGGGVVDRIVCGSGTDTVTAGLEDDVAGDCESVERD